MHHIYKRAQAVLVWLGTADIGKEVWHTTFGPIGFTDSHEVNVGENLISEMCNRDYWNRVWIVQEIGKAKKIWIHYGIEMVDWDTFIEVVKKIGSFGDCVPLKLANQLSQKFSDGHRLENLLRLHKNALCKEPRDKVYGFTGLAVDCHDRLPIDYEKSLFDVWKDAMLFKHYDRRASQFDILQFGRLVKLMLGGPGIATKEELKKEKTLHDFPIVREDPGVLRIPVLLRGIIVHLGPTYDELFSDLRKADPWEVALDSTIAERFMTNTRIENDLFIELLNELDDADLKRIHKFDRDTSFKYPQFTRQQAEDWFFSTVKRSVETEPLRDESRPWTNPPLIDEERSLSSTTSSQPRLFILKTWEEQMGIPASWMGLVPKEAVEGDFICHLYGTDLAVVVRRQKEDIDFDGIYELIGTAVVAKDHVTAHSTRDDKPGETHKFAAPYSSGEKRQFECVPLYMDLALAYELSI